MDAEAAAGELQGPFGRPSAAAGRTRGRTGGEEPRPRRKERVEEPLRGEEPVDRPTPRDAPAPRAADEASARAADRLSALADRFEAVRARYEARRDERAICAHAFHQFHVHLAESTRANRFGYEDPDWVAALAEAFAERFFVAMDDIDRLLAEAGEDAVPERLRECGSKPWADVFGAICLERSYASEALFFPLLAHIGYDLPMALADTGLSTGGRSHLEDFHRINDALADLVDDVQRSVALRYCPRLRYLDRLAGKLDERVTRYAFKLTRATAWYNAMRLQDPAAREEAHRAIEAVAERLIGRLRRPPERVRRVVTVLARRTIPVRKTWPPPDEARS